MESQGQTFECFCGDQFDTREQLIDHNVSEHGMGPEESRDRVNQKYPPA